MILFVIECNGIQNLRQSFYQRDTEGVFHIDFALSGKFNGFLVEIDELPGGLSRLIDPIEWTIQ